MEELQPIHKTVELIIHASKQKSVFARQISKHNLVVNFPSNYDDKAS